MLESSARAESLVLAPIGEVFDLVVATPPPEFYPSFGPLPAVRRVSDQTGPFTEVGSSRMLHLSDGSSVTETVVEIDTPRFHSYRLTGFTKLFGNLVDHAVAEWSFVPEGAATRIRWTYTFVGKMGRGWIVRLIVRLFWGRYMVKVLPPIARQAGPLA